MVNELKKKLYEYFKAKENKTPEEESLLKELELEMYYADINGMSIGVEDIETYKPDASNMTWDELCEFADRVAEYMADDVGVAIADIVCSGEYEGDDGWEDED